MHKIYENAYRTIVLVPEFHVALHSSVSSLVKLVESQWFKRVWTLAESYKSRSLLFVGSDAYMYSDIFDMKHEKYGSQQGDFEGLLSTICTKSAFIIR